MAKGFHTLIIGGGPAGLYAAILIKRARADAEITIVERNPRGATFGFGVVFSDQAFQFLSQDDPETAELIDPHMHRWFDIHINHPKAHIEIDGIGFSGIGRLTLLGILERRLAELGVQVTHDCALMPPDFPEVDLIIGADGLNSAVRGANPAAFGEQIDPHNNWFAWYGTDRMFDALTQTFIETPFGPMNAHHYSYGPGQSTFIIEMTNATFQRSGFQDMEEPTVRTLCEDAFAESLAGASLIPNNSIWRQFPHLTCAKWFHGNQVLIGDALHTAHFSIGSGTRLALEDAIALVRSLEANDWDVPAGLANYQKERQAILVKLLAAARASARWYEVFDITMSLDPWQFALSYIRRGGRIDGTRLQQMSPTFTSELRRRNISLD